jgi:hypothetical protein
MLFQNMIQEFSTGPIHHVVDLFETIRAAVVWVRNLGSGTALGIELSEEIKGGITPNDFPVLLEMGEVGLVHGHDIVEPSEVLGLDLPCVTGEGDAMGGRAPDRPMIRALSHVPASGSGRVYKKPIRELSLVEDIPENTLGQRRAADVTETHEEDGDLLGHSRTSSFWWFSRHYGSK